MPPILSHHFYRSKVIFGIAATGCIQLHNNLPTVVTVQGVEREFSLCHSRTASRLKAAVHVHLGAPVARGMIKTGR